MTSLVPNVIGLILGLYMMELRFRIKGVRFGKVQVDLMQNKLVLS